MIDRLLKGCLEARLVVGPKFHVIPGKVQLAGPDGIQPVEMDRCGDLNVVGEGLVAWLTWVKVETSGPKKFSRPRIQAAWVLAGEKHGRGLCVIWLAAFHVRRGDDPAPWHGLALC